MSACNIEVIKMLGKYLNTPVGTVCYNTDKVLTTVLNKQNVEGFASIVLRLTAASGAKMSQEETLLNYQWLEYIAMYANQAAVNPAFAKGFLQDINNTLEKTAYLTGQRISVTDVAAYYAFYPLLERLTVSEKESIMHVCRWLKNIQAQPRVSVNKPPLPLNILTLAVLAPAVH